MTTRAVLDTNVLVSGLGWGGPPGAILDAVSDGRVMLITSAPLIDELRRVLAYPKLTKVVGDAAGLADIIAPIVTAAQFVMTVLSRGSGEQ